MRGKASFSGHVEPGDGITPAYAGKRSGRSIGRRLSGDHPRVCGEKYLFFTEGLFLAGSPPRMRGKVVYKKSTLSTKRITPAYAGKSPSCAIMLPRLNGSPPRMRGKANPRVCRVCCHGITPAYAGKSSSRAAFLLFWEDHPRVCGEKPSTQRSPPTTSGSPPRMRGKGGKDLGGLNDVGITPAYAGKSPPRPLSGSAMRDHPRVCGEKTKKIP